MVPPRSDRAHHTTGGAGAHGRFRGHFPRNVARRFSAPAANPS
jgi:hypothetical protein